MKKSILVFILLLIGIVAFSQDIIYTVSGELNGVKIPLDSIVVENLTTGQRNRFDQMPANEYYMINLTKNAYWGTVGIGNLKLSTFCEMRNIPGLLTVSFLGNSPEKVRIVVYNLIGQIVYSGSSKTIFPGNAVEVRLANSGLYFVTIETLSESKTVKAVGSFSVTDFGEAVFEPTTAATKLKNVTISGTLLTEFMPGDSIRVSVFKKGYYSEPQLFRFDNSKSLNFLLQISAAAPDNMILVQGGIFQMGGITGDIYEQPLHSVALNSFIIGKTEVTQAQWKTVMGSNPSYFKGNNLPVERVSWNDIQTFIQKLNQQTGKIFRLPTEAEWEFAARGGGLTRSLTEYPGSNIIGDVAWYASNSGNKTHPVGTKLPNELGLFDMGGNVKEWCADLSGGYSSDAQSNPTGSTTGDSRVLRGGGWFSQAYGCRVACRSSSGPLLRDETVGFRLALNANDTNAPVPDFTTNLTSTIVGQIIQFTDKSTNTPTNWLWNFGDGTTSTDQNPSHAYKIPGTYTISLKAINSYGNSTKIMNIQVAYANLNDAFEMLLVKGGTFQMGSLMGESNEQPIHSVTISSFYMSKTEVTQAQWVAVMNTNPSNDKGDNLPVGQVSWNDLQTFITKLNLQTGKDYRLPTEAEWEFAARSGVSSGSTTYAGSNSIDDVAWFWDNGGGTTHPVGIKLPNELGLYDMSGNVGEWCADWYGNYGSEAQINP